MLEIATVALLALVQEKPAVRFECCSSMIRRSSTSVVVASSSMTTAIRTDCLGSGTVSPWMIKVSVSSVEPLS